MAQSEQINDKYFKNHYMMFHRTRIKHNTHLKIIINNDIVDYINNTKFLGVIIDSKLNYAAHILYIKSQISRSIVILLKIRKFIQNNTMRNIYFTFICPYLIYCIEVWDMLIKSI